MLPTNVRENSRGTSLFLSIIVVLFILDNILNRGRVTKQIFRMLFWSNRGRKRRVLEVSGGTGGDFGGFGGFGGGASGGSSGGSGGVWRRFLWWRRFFWKLVVLKLKTVA